MEIEQMDVEMRLAGAIDDLSKVMVSDKILQAIIEAAHKWRLSTQTLSKAWNSHVDTYIAANCVVTSSEI